MERDMEDIYWDKLTRVQQDLYLGLLWNDGHSERAIASFLHTTKGRIVRRRHTNKLSRKRIGEVKQEVNPERFQDLLDLNAMEKVEEKGVAAIAPLGHCKWPLPESTLRRKPVLCGKPVVPGHELCEEHLAQTRKLLKLP
jgi:hypothetical protein